MYFDLRLGALYFTCFFLQRLNAVGLFLHSELDRKARIEKQRKRLVTSYISYYFAFFSRLSMKQGANKLLKLGLWKEKSEVRECLSHKKGDKEPFEKEDRPSVEDFLRFNLRRVNWSLELT